MDALAGPARLADQIPSVPVSLNPERCLQWRHKRAPCRRCIESCPTQAVTPAEPVTLDGRRCVGCGLCLHLCPTQAFRGPGNGGSKLLRVLGSLHGDAVELACNRKPDLSLSRAPISSVVEVNPCLASLSLPTLLMAVTQPPLDDGSHNGNGRGTGIWLNDRPCQTCPAGAVQREVRQGAAAANRLLAAFGYGARIFTYGSAPERLLPSALAQPVVRGDTLLYSRRDLFDSLRSQSRRLLDALLAGSPAGEGRPADEGRLAHHLPSGRRALARTLERLGQPAVDRISATGLSLGTVSINENCSACGLCARLCPTGALTFATSNQTFAIRFTPVECLGCTICSLICPSGALAFESEVNLQLLVAWTSKLVHTGQLAPCRVCGGPCAGHHGQSRCFVCRRQEDVKESA